MFIAAPPQNHLRSGRSAMCHGRCANTCRSSAETAGSSEVILHKRFLTPEESNVYKPSMQKEFALL
jgi:hypothetical protein